MTKSKVDVCSKNSFKNYLFFLQNEILPGIFDYSRDMMFKSDFHLRYEIICKDFCPVGIRQKSARIADRTISEIRPDTGPDLMSGTPLVVSQLYSHTPSALNAEAKLSVVPVLVQRLVLTNADLEWREA